MDSFKGTTGPPILNDIETFFLVDHHAETNSIPIEFRAHETTLLTETFGSVHIDEYVFVTGETSNEMTRLTISSAKGSKIRLDHNVSVELPKFGSTIIATDNPIRDGHYTYLWVMARQ